MHIGVDTLPVMPKDATDRNRTSPFAFTGNKFEFRAVGSHQSCAGPNVALNTIVAESLDEIATILEKAKGPKFNKTLQELLQKIVKEHKRVIFNGDNYSDDWKKEAARRGLPNFTNTPVALKALSSAKAGKLFEKYKVLSKVELHSRYDIYVEEYEKTILIEGKLALDMAKTSIMPAVVQHQTMLASNILVLEQAGVSASVKEQKASLEKISEIAASLLGACGRLSSSIAKHDPAEIVAGMSQLRKQVDAAELEVDDGLWPLPKYRELLFMY